MFYILFVKVAEVCGGPYTIPHNALSTETYTVLPPVCRTHAVALCLHAVAQPPQQPHTNAITKLLTQCPLPIRKPPIPLARYTPNSLLRKTLDIYSKHMIHTSCFGGAGGGT